MRFIIPISLAILLLALILPLIFVYRPMPSVPVTAEADEPAVGPQDQDAAARHRGPETYDSPLQDADFILQVLIEGEIHAMSMEELLQGVVAAEMPARFHPEALKAQAVAARTYALHRMLVAPSPRHPRADVCDSYACCKAFHSPERLRERWGDRFAHYRAIIAAAVRATDGMILLYETQPILAAFHAASYGFTETSGAIWGDVPYLQSVRSFEGAAEVPRFYETVEIHFSAFRDTVRAAHPDAALENSNPSDWITNVHHTDSGRLAGLDIGGVTLTGAEFRRLFGLRSTAVQFDFGAEKIAITTGGHGHGVGMSQFGANTMAHMGLDFQAILHWYYTDVVPGRIDDLKTN